LEHTCGNHSHRSTFSCRSRSPLAFDTGRNYICGGLRSAGLLLFRRSPAVIVRMQGKQCRLLHCTVTVHHNSSCNKYGGLPGCRICTRSIINIDVTKNPLFSGLFVLAFCRTCIWCLTLFTTDTFYDYLNMFWRRVALPFEEATRCVPHYLDGPSCPVGTCLYSPERNPTLQNIKLVVFGVRHFLQLSGRNHRWRILKQN
jgi:hypothetical protein